MVQHGTWSPDLNSRLEQSTQMACIPHPGVLNNDTQALKLITVIVKRIL